MIDLGLDDLEVAEMLTRALSVIDGPVEDCWSEFLKEKDNTEESELVRLYEEMPAGPIDITGVIAVGVETARSCLNQISFIIQNPVPTSPVVLQTLLRAALVGSARTLYVLLPTDPDERLERAHKVVARDTESGRQGLRQFAGFQGMRAFAAPEDLVESMTNHRKELWPKGNPPGDGKIVEGMSAVMHDALELAGVGEELGHEFLTDHVTWLWNTYSGLAHGYFWPRLLPGLAEDDRRIPGDFPLDLHQIATATHMALLAALSRMAPGSTLTTETIPNNWPAN
ncbi:hypothetical protein [Brevibacterium antiquum]|uniref:Uncharacterized protein n=1 Tax=Brevibacterium antiquum TaxID=234835 RepID=A0A2H1KPD7_9MICO|nr:hypothetical protein [Brevibacterium antiquum]SMY01673.1 hypothetical protein BANT10_03304 [Brevibacterium antiquum]